MRNSNRSRHQHVQIALVVMFLLGFAATMPARAEHNGSCHLPEGPVVIFEDILSDGWSIYGAWGGASLGGFTLATGEQVLALQTSSPWTGVGVYAGNLNQYIGTVGAFVFRVRFEAPVLRLFVGMQRVYTSEVDVWKEVISYLDGGNILTPVPGQWYTVRIPKADIAGSDERMEGLVFQTDGAGTIYIDNLAVSDSPGLAFPLDCSTPGCSGENNINYTAGAYTHGTVISVVDHSMKKNEASGNYPYGLTSADVNGTVLAWTGEKGESITPAVQGCYQQTSGEPFSINGTYVGSPGDGCTADYLNYDDHPGYDYKATYGTTVKAATSGTVVDFNNQRCIPNGITCTGSGAVGVDDGNGFITQYLHMRNITVNKGDAIVVGQSLGESGDVGAEGNPHLHFEVLRRIPGSSGNSLSDYKVIDPYGWHDACDADPLYRQITGVCSFPMWK